MAASDEGSSLSARSGNDLAGPAEAYGPITLRRYVKGDGRALILYTHGGPAHDGTAHDGPAYEGAAHKEPSHYEHGSAHEGHERA